MSVPARARRGFVLGALLLAIASVTACSAGSSFLALANDLPATGAQEPGAGGGSDPAPGAKGDDPVVGQPGFDGGPPDDGAKLITPTPGLRDVREQPWDRVSVSADGKTLTVYFWSGVDTCYGLADVKATTVDGVLKVSVFTGNRPLPADTACIDLAQLYKVVITLDQPLVLGGAA
jgi:hypothetical protein